jgi:cephalosporin-C deacetylase
MDPAAKPTRQIPKVPMHSVARRSALVFALLAAALAGAAHSVAQQPSFTPDRPSGIYAVGERVGWTVALSGSAGRAIQRSGPYTYTIRQNGGQLIASGSLDLASGPARIETTLTEPAMLLVEVGPPVPDTTFGDRSTGGPGRVLLGAAVEPHGIRPAEPKPADFDAFWDAKLAELEAIPMDAVLMQGESDRPGVEYATLRMNNLQGARVYGQLARPAGEGAYPALVIYQWASPPYPLRKEWVTDRAAEGWLVLNIQPHDVPVDMPQAFYDALPARTRNYHTIGQHSRDESYFLPMYLGAYRAIEYLARRPDWDGSTMVVTGTSMGGQQALAAAGLNRRVTALVVHVPAGADVTAALHGRAPSYPNWNVARPEVLETARYFDVANFAERITARSLVSIAFIDELTTPASIWATFNRIQGPKEAVPLPDAAHNHLATAEQQRPYTSRAAEWLETLVRGGDPTVASGTPSSAPTNTMPPAVIPAWMAILRLRSLVRPTRCLPPAVIPAWVAILRLRSLVRPTRCLPSAVIPAWVAILRLRALVRPTRCLPPAVIPAKAGIQCRSATPVVQPWCVEEQLLDRAVHPVNPRSSRLHLLSFAFWASGPEA